MADLWSWVTVGDNRVCPDCESRQDFEPMTWDAWFDIGLPRTGQTVCTDACRCDIFPARLVKDIADQLPDEVNIKELQPEIDALIDELMRGVTFDKMTGRAILLKDFKDATGLKSLSLSEAALFDALFERLTALIVRFNSLGRVLPKSYYQLDGVRAKISWLERELGDG